MSRRSPKHELTRMEAAAVQAMITGEKQTKACEIAGYSDPRGEGKRLLRKPDVAKLLIQSMQTKMVKFEALLQKATVAVDYNLTPDNWEKVDKNGRMLITAADRNAAAKIVFDAIAKSDPKALSTKAREEDTAIDKKDAVEGVMGPEPTTIQ